MQNLRSKDLHNGALIAEDYQTGEIVAYVGSADANATKATKKFQPQFDVLADGWRQPGSAFKPIMYATGISQRYITAASMFMDVVTDFGGGYVPADADLLERGPVRVRDALRFSLNIPAVKTMSVVGVERVQKQAEAMGVNFQNGPTNAGLSFALGVSEVHGIDLVRAYGTLGDGGKLADQTTLRSVKDPSNTELLGADAHADPKQAIDAGTAYIMTDILAGNTDPNQNPFWGKFELTAAGGRHRPATLKTGTNNDAKDLNAYGYIGQPSSADRKNGEYALAVGVWAGNSDNSLVSTPNAPLLSLDVTTYVWQGFLQEATKGWSVNGFARPDGLVQAKVDAWTGMTPSAPVAGAGPSPTVDELFLPGTAPTGSLPAGTCGADVLSAVGFEGTSQAWLDADAGWLKRAQRGAGVAGGPKRTRTTYFYNGFFSPYGHSWGPLVGGEGCGTPSPSPSIDPCASPLTPASVDPLASVDPSASVFACPSPSGASASPSAPPSEPPMPTATPPPPTPSPPPPPTPTPTPTPTPPPSAPSVAPSALRPSWLRAA
jgi:membrane peptidoglycan carboxypeptidase